MDPARNVCREWSVEAAPSVLVVCALNAGCNATAVLQRVRIGSRVWRAPRARVLVQLCWVRLGAALRVCALD